MMKSGRKITVWSATEILMHIIVRISWRKWGNPTLTDYDDLFKLFGDVKEAYPEMVPFTLMWNIGDIFTKMMGLQNKTELYVTDDGTISYGITDSEYIDYYQWFNKLVSVGVCH